MLSFDGEKKETETFPRIMSIISIRRRELQMKIHV